MTVASFSKLNTFSRCWRKYYYAYILQLQRKVQSIKPVQGILFHECLNLYYSGKDYTSVIQNLKIDMDNLFDEEKEEWLTLPTTLNKLMRGYTFAYRDIDKKIKTRYVEKDFSIPLEKHTLEGRIDWGFEDEQGFWVADHKTVTSIPTTNFGFGDVQTTLYYEAERQMGNAPVGVVFNFIKSKPPRQPEILKDGKSVSRAKIDTDIPTYMAAVRAAGGDINDYSDMVEKLSGNVFFKRVRIPTPTNLVEGVVKDAISKMNMMEVLDSRKNSKDLFYRSIIKDRCEWDCEFSPLCFAELAKQDTSYMLENNYEPRRNKNEKETNAGD